MSVVLTTKTIKLGNKETIKTRKEVRKIRTWKLTERRIGVTQWSLISAVGAERGRSRISNIYISLPCRFFIAISNAPKQIGKCIEVSKDFTLSSIRRSSVTKFINCSDTGIYHQIQGGVKRKNNCTKHEKEMKYDMWANIKERGNPGEEKNLGDGQSPTLPHHPLGSPLSQGMDPAMKRKHGWTNLKRIETDCNGGFWKLASLAVSQGLYRFISFIMVCNVW